MPATRPGITAPIIPGILPIENWDGAKQIRRPLRHPGPRLAGRGLHQATRDGREDLLATALCTELCDTLMQDGVEDLHFYTLNRPHLTRDVCHALGVTPEVALEKVA